jgi:hypothetical protein
VRIDAPVRSRRASVAALLTPVGLSREAEYSYIRADMRRLLITAAGLLALMLVILVIVER